MQQYNSRVAPAPSDSDQSSYENPIQRQNKGLKPTNGKKSGQRSALSGSDIKYLMTRAKENIEQIFFQQTLLELNNVFKGKVVFYLL